MKAGDFQTGYSINHLKFLPFPLVWPLNERVKKGKTFSAGVGSWDGEHQNMNRINEAQWKKEGFFLQMSSDRYLLASGPFVLSDKPNAHQWSLFRPPFFSGLCSRKASDKSFYWYTASEAAFYSRKELLSFLKDQRVKQNIKDWDWKDPCFFQFRDFFFKMKKQMAEGKLQKVVPACFKTASYSLKAKDIPSFLYPLIKAEQGGAAYGWWSGGRALFGLTPEYLFRKQGLYVQSLALAGTARDPEHNLLADPKERKEHRLVVEEIQKLLSPLGKYYVSDTYIHSLGGISHLRTDFKLRLKKHISCEKLCFILHPTPALGGVPRRRALELLSLFHQKTQKRHDFGAPFCVSKEEQALCVVAIRNIQFIKAKVYLGAGCGLVQESQLEREWGELKKKQMFIWNIFS